jgi:putative DNA primase/helicase
VVSMSEKSREIKQTIEARFDEVGLLGPKFTKVGDGEKKCIDHDTRWDSPAEVPGQNYGIYSDEDTQVVVLDVDYHREGIDDLSNVALAALSALPRTLKLQSPHVPEEGRGGHRVYKLAGDQTPAELFKEKFGKKNPVPSWGEVIAKNKYIVGAGSQLDDCIKDFCERCAKPDGGWYAIKEDREIATVEPGDLVEALGADPDLERTDTSDENETLDTSTSATRTHADEVSDRNYDDLDRETVEGMLDHLPGNQHYDDWIRTCFAVYDWDDGETGKEVCEEWSKSNEKWDSTESQRRIDDIWTNRDADGDADGNASVGTLVHLAIENGFEFENGNPPAPETGDDPDWETVRDLYQWAENERNVNRGKARVAAADVLEKETAWMYVLEEERLWVYDEETGTFDSFGKATVERRLVRELGEFYTQGEKREIAALLKGRNQVHRREQNARQHDDPLVSVGNGVVNLRTGDLLDHSPEYRFVRGIDWDYDLEKADENRILEFLDDVTEREVDRDTLLDHLAHGLMPGHPYRAFVVCYGPGGNGKTQVAEVFRGFVGEDNAAAVEIDEFTSDDFATSDLPGTFLNWGDDMAGDGGGSLDDLSLLKKATGNSEIRANAKHEKTFNFKNEAAMFFSANEPPRIGEKKRSIQDRIYPIEMPYEFKGKPDPDDPMQKKKTPNISKRLLDDGEAMRGLLALVVEHAQRLIETYGDYSQPESPEERLEKYNKTADPIVKFGSRALESADPGYKIRKDDLYRVYRTFTDEWGERSTSERAFKRQFPDAFPEEIEDGQSRPLATPDDEGDRVTCYKRLKWTDRAKSRMPDWMEERYSDHFEASTDDDDDPDMDTDEGYATPLDEIEPGRETLEVEVVAQFDPKPWLQAEGEFVDDSGTVVDYVARGQENPAPELEEGGRYRIGNAKVETDENGVLQIRLTRSAHIESLEQPDEGQGQLDETPDTSDDTEATADGGVDVEGKMQESEGVYAALREVRNRIDSTNTPMSREDIITDVVMNHNNQFTGSGETARDAFETAVTNGMFIKTPDGYVAGGE